MFNKRSRWEHTRPVTAGAKKTREPALRRTPRALEQCSTTGACFAALATAVCWNDTTTGAGAAWATAGAGATNTSTGAGTAKETAGGRATNITTA